MTFEQEGTCDSWAEADQAIKLARNATPVTRLAEHVPYLRAVSDGWQWGWVLRQHYLAANDLFQLQQQKPKRSKATFHNNTKPDGQPLKQMVLFSGSRKCLAGQNDLPLAD